MAKKLPVSSPAIIPSIDKLYQQIATHLQAARHRILNTINIEMVQTYWLIGKIIVEEEQCGETRADYGQALIKTLASRLTHQFGRGFNARSLERMRKFYLVYANSATLRPKSVLPEKSATAWPELELTPTTWQLSWSHYRLLITLESEYKRAFYEGEAVKNRWSVRELERQIGSLLFDRLAKSKDEQGLLQLALEGQEIVKPEDAIKDPLILEFLNLPESPRLVESELEAALLTNLQQFLLEMGRGFAFVARQQRLTLNHNHYYCDLVLYHTVLKCYVLVDCKTKTLTHGDLGQMQLYVNYYDKECLSEGDNPTIGLILCTEKDDAMVQYTLGDKAKQIFASRYMLYLPTEAELAAEIRRELKDIQYTKRKNI